MTASFPSFGADQLATLKAEMALFEDRLRAARRPSRILRAFLLVGAVFSTAGYLTRREVERLRKRREVSR